MRNIITILLVFVCLNLYSQTKKQVKTSQKDLLDNICNYLRLSNSWSSSVCPKSDFNPDENWQKPFFYGLDIYQTKYIQGLSSPKKSYDILIDTSNLVLHFPVQDIGGPGKASGSEQSFSINFRNLKDINWKVENNQIILILYAYDNTTVGEYYQANNCYIVKYELRLLEIKFSKDLFSETISKKMESSIRKVIQ